MRLLSALAFALALPFIAGAGCNESLTNDEQRDVVTGLNAVELLECQESGDECPSPEDPSLLCCPIAAGAGCDCFSIGGTQGAGGTCSAICDGGGGERRQDENGCWYWESPSGDGCMMTDAGGPDVVSTDAGPTDTAPSGDGGGPLDAGRPSDGSGEDAGSPGEDTGSPGEDTPRSDAGRVDAGPIDAG